MYRAFVGQGYSEQHSGSGPAPGDKKIATLRSLLPNTLRLKAKVPPTEDKTKQIRF